MACVSVGVAFDVFGRFIDKAQRTDCGIYVAKHKLNGTP